MNQNENTNNSNIEFIPAVCPKCGGRLELDSSFEIAYCKDCNSQVLIRNATRKERKLIDKLIGLFEREQSLIKQDIIEKHKQKLNQIQKEEHQKQIKRKERKEWWHKNYFKVIMIIIVLLIISIICDYLGLLN